MFWRGPVERTVVARLRDRIKRAEAELREKQESLDTFMKDQIERLRRENENDKSKALDDIVGGLLKGN